MSSTAEMSALVREAADLSSTTQNWKDRVQAAARAIQITFARAKSFYFNEARRVEAEEMDRARAAVFDLRERERRQREAAHLVWLQQEIVRLRASGEEFHGASLDGLERVLRGAGGGIGALAVPATTEALNYSVPTE